MSRLGWRMTYGGAPETNFFCKSGYAAPSWHTFDRRVWERTLPNGVVQELVLINLGNLMRPKPPKPKGKQTTYQVTLREKASGAVILMREGHDWHTLVREMKAG